MFILTNQHHFLTTYVWDALNVNANRTESSLSNTEKCLNHEFLLEQLKNYQTQRRLRGPTTWKDRLKHPLKDTANWRTKKTEQLYKVRSLCLDDHQFKKVELESVAELSDVRTQVVLTCLTNLLEGSLNGQEHVTDAWQG